MRWFAAVWCLALVGGCQSPRFESDLIQVPEGWVPPGFHAVALEAESDLEQFVFTDPDAFAIEDSALVMVREGRSEPRHRSPLGIAVLREPLVTEFVLRCRAVQSGREYGHRDLVFVFGYQDAEHYYYAHLASEADGTSHHVMIVDGADRRPITTRRTDGVAWGAADAWHSIHILRRKELIRAYFDGIMVLEAHDTAFGTGRVGLGSFDDTGAFRDISISEFLD